MGDNDRETKELYVSDEPIKYGDHDADLFGSHALARNIASCVLDNCKRRGFVIGVLGGWGSGKTTLLGHLSSELQKAKGVVQFYYNPWLYPGEERLAFFFRELSGALLTQSIRHSRRLNSLLRKYAHYIEFGADVNDVLVSCLKLLSPLAAGSAVMWILICQGKIVPTILVAVSGLASLLTHASSILRKITKALRQFGIGPVVTLSEMKEMCSTAIKKSKQSVVVLIDDIDRLPPKELCEVFQLVKNNGDLECVSYVLAYDQAVVSHAIAGHYGSGVYGSFTEKITQIEFQMPPMELSQIEVFFTRQLQRIRKSFSEKNLVTWSEERWSECFVYLKYTIETLRVAKRVLNGVALSATLMLRGEYPEINAVDFVVLEVIRVRFPEVLAVMRESSSYFIYARDERDYLALDDVTWQSRQKAVRERVRDIGGKHGDVLLEVLDRLFPAFAMQSLMDSFSTGTQVVLERQLRVCTTPVFYRYLLYRAFIGDIPNSVIQKIVDSISDVTVAAQKLYRFRSSGQFRMVLDRVSRYSISSGQNVETATNVVRLLISSCDELPDETSPMSDEPIRFWVADIVEYVLRPFAANERADIISVAFSPLSGVYVPVIVVAYAEQRRTEDDKCEWLPQDSLDSVRAAVLSHLKQSLRNGYLQRVRDLHTMLFFAKKWSSDSFIESFSVFIDQKGAMASVLRAYLDKRAIETDDKGPSAVSYGFRFDAIEALGVLPVVIDRFEKLDPRWDFDVPTRIALRVFGNLLPKYQTNPDEWKEEGGPSVR